VRFSNVCLEAFGYTVPDEVVTSSEIEARLAPLYQRLRLPEGRLELMTGIRERRFWPRGVLPSQPSAASAQKAIEGSGIPPAEIGALIHASVCRDYLEPATACVVHQALQLPDQCLLYDCSNACLGFLNGMVQAAGLIELGQVRAAVVVATEGSRELVENTIAHLNAEQSLTRDSVKLAIASLTIGSASVAAVLCHRDLSKRKSFLLGGVARADTRGAGLCHSGRDEAVAGEMKPLMQTDSEALLHAGIALGAKTFADLCRELRWTPGQIQKTFCHQIGVAHRKLMFESLGLDVAIDYQTLDWLGNTGSAALPITMARGIEAGHVQPGDRVAMLGIGSGINSIMLGVEWGRG
jgi:3-oxoacyl-[acyl-carrier-protein] synthase-3